MAVRAGNKEVWYFGNYDCRVCWKWVQDGQVAVEMRPTADICHEACLEEHNQHHTSGERMGWSGTPYLDSWDRRTGKSTFDCAACRIERQPLYKER